MSELKKQKIQEVIDGALEKVDDLSDLFYTVFKLEAADGKLDDKIPADAWNKFAEEQGLQKVNTDFIRTQEAIELIKNKK